MLIVPNKEKINNFNTNNLCIITDFDKTLTTNKSESTIGVFTSFLTHDYKVVKDAIMELEYTITSNTSLNESDKAKQLRQIWILKLRLLSTFLKDKNIIDDIASSGLFCMREDSIEVLNYLQKKYRVIINSSGLGNMILSILKYNNCNFSNLSVFSNYLKFSENDSFDLKEIIDPYCKTNTYYLNAISSYNNFVLLGDSLQDLTMIPRMNNKVISIGFLDDEYDSYIGNFISNFDVVATNNEKFSEPIKMLKL